jgi:hypothetical protein
MNAIKPLIEESEQLRIAIDALKQIAYPLEYIKNQVNGKTDRTMAIKMASDPHYLSRVAKNALEKLK